LVEKYLGKKAVIEILPAQPGDVDRTAANISHAQNLIGYNPSVSIEEGIKRTVEWYQEHIRHHSRPHRRKPGHRTLKEISKESSKDSSKDSSNS
jgi:dTDP-D-glucose 4,6-dehydratase